MDSMTTATLPLNRKEAAELCMKMRKQQKRIRQADSLIDTIFLCLNVHARDLTEYSVHDTVDCIVKEIRRYKEETAGAEIKKKSRRLSVCE